MSDKNKLGSPFAGSRRIGRRWGRKEARRKREREKGAFTPFSFPSARVPPFYFQPWLDGGAHKARARDRDPEDEKRRGTGKRGWSHNAADIAKELHVTRKFVYTVSVPLPSSGNVHRCPPAFHSTPMTRILKLYFLSTLSRYIFTNERVESRGVLASSREEI